jgi:predicted porin
MKKSLLALAVMGAFAGAAQAQSAVTIYGSFDGGIRSVDNAFTAANGEIARRTTMSSVGNYNNNRIGFRGVEDLGGGLNARFVLETGWNTGTGALDNTANRLFQRTATVGLGGAWGGIDFGRQYSVAFKTIGGYDPFSYKYTGIIPLATAAPGSTGNTLAAPGANTAVVTSIATSPYFSQGGSRFDNDIQYTGNFGPATIRAEYALGEQAGSTSNGATTAIGGTFAMDAFSIGGAYTTRKNNDTLASPTVQTWRDNDNWTIGAAFKTGPFRVAAGYMNDKQDARVPGNRDTEVRNAWVGGSYALSPALELTAGFYQTKRESAATDGRRNLLMIGTTYALSKRTNLYAAVDSAKLKGDFIMTNTAGQVEDRVTGINLGVNHLF